MVTVAYLDSGLGLVSYADALLARRRDARVVLSMDPDHAPYGSLSRGGIVERILASARACAPYEPDAIVVACNTGSVHALAQLRAEWEPDVPVIGTVPAVRSAARSGLPMAVWATPATTSSRYQADLIGQFATGIPVTAVAADGLAAAIDLADPALIDAAVADAAAKTPADARSVVLGCTHYGLVAERIRAALASRGPGDVAIFDSPEPVARQTLARLGLSDDAASAPAPGAPSSGRVLATLQSGRASPLPESLLAYPAGRRLLAAQWS